MHIYNMLTLSWRSLVIVSFVSRLPMDVPQQNCAEKSTDLGTLLGEGESSVSLYDLLTVWHFELQSIDLLLVASDKTYL